MVLGFVASVFLHRTDRTHHLQGYHFMGGEEGVLYPGRCWGIGGTRGGGLRNDERNDQG
ncbi:MAG: hypothetical protein OEO23_06575 [Gemmatimonadota bacterium]|nr:hypothetical protein [Gemmatimonadota bacterium]